MELMEECAAGERMGGFRKRIPCRRQLCSNEKAIGSSGKSFSIPFPQMSRRE
jgi:hypothetical protein